MLITESIVCTGLAAFSSRYKKPNNFQIRTAHYKADQVQPTDLRRRFVQVLNRGFALTYVLVEDVRFNVEKVTVD